MKEEETWRDYFVPGKLYQFDAEYERQYTGFDEEVEEGTLTFWTFEEEHTDQPWRTQVDTSIDKVIMYLGPKYAHWYEREVPSFLLDTKVVASYNNITEHPYYKIFKRVDEES